MIDELLTTGLWRLLLVQSTACLATGLAASIVLRRRPARAHQVLFAALLVAVLMPGLYLSARQFGFGVFAPITVTSCGTPAPEGVLSPTEGGWATSAPLLTTEVADEPTPLGAEPVAGAATSGAATGRVSRAIIGAACWLAVTAVLLARLVLRFLLGFRLLRAAEPVEAERISDSVARARNRLGIGPRVRIRRSGKVRSPIIWCWVREPVLLLHRAADDDPTGTDWVDVFCHELAHWRRRDHLSGLFAELLVALLPWHPLLWWAKGRLLALSEQACDDWVLATGPTGVDYAEILLGLAAERRMAFLPTVIGKEKTMNTRIRRIIKDNGSDPRIGTRWALVVGALAVCTTLGVAVAQKRPAGPEPMDPPPGRVRVEREESVREVRERPEIDRQRTAMKRLIEQLSQQAAEKKAMLGEGRDLSPEERQIREIELKLLVEQIEQMRSRLETVGRETVQPRKRLETVQRGPVASSSTSRSYSLQQRHDDLVRQAQKMEDELAGLQDGRNPEADELKMQLKDVHGQIRDVEKRMEEQKRAQAEAERDTTEERLTRVRRAAEQTARNAQERALTDQLKMQLAQIGKQLQERKARGEGESPETQRLLELQRALQERLRAKEEMPASPEGLATRRIERRPPEPGTRKTEVRVFRLERADPERVADALRSAFGESIQSAYVDTGANTLALTATPEIMARVENLVRQLDAPAGRRNLDAEVEDLRIQMKEMHEQMRQMQKLLEQAVDRGPRDRPAAVVER
jgi:beta-lactamase regulating signal transducer with metallopeptidase domain